MNAEPADHVVVVLDRDRRTPFGPPRSKVDADAMALRLRAWGLNALALPGTVVAGRFVPVEGAAA